MKIGNNMGRAPQIALAALAAGGLAAMTISCSDTSEDLIEAGDETGEEVSVLSASDGDWIRLDGVIESAAASTFVLDYGDDSITVEVDDWDLTQEGLALVEGDRVSVTGRVDREMFSRATLEASAIYVQNLNTVYYANAADEEEFGLTAVPLSAAPEGVDYTGWVTGTSEGGFTLGSEATLINVDTSGLTTPLAKSGIAAGDRVYVWGDFELSAEGQSTLVAEGLGSGLLWLPPVMQEGF